MDPINGRISLYEANEDSLGNDLKEIDDDMKYLSTEPPDEDLRDFNLYDEEGTSESSPSKYTYSKDPSDESRGKLKSSHGKYASYSITISSSSSSSSKQIIICIPNQLCHPPHLQRDQMRRQFRRN